MTLYRLVEKSTGKEKFFTLEKLEKFIKTNKILHGGLFGIDPSKYDLYFHMEPTKTMITLYGSKK